MNDIGDKILCFKNAEDINSAFILEITDVFEVGLNEFYFEITEKEIKHEERR